MHELSIAKSLLDILKEQAESHNIKKAVKVKLKLGRFTAVEPSSLRFCFQILSEKTVFEGAVLEIDETSGNELDLIGMEAE
ncbi:MAG: hydrogenase maturation nickel metallochaperone HypA [Deltaproteobacteria bacterium]|nr:hydrogenase maturation nickel metallochaperone HypA [Deltaproteobacteria bacterium]